MQQLDVRTIVPRERHPKIFNLFDGLESGDAFELVNDPSRSSTSFRRSAPDW